MESMNNFHNSIDSIKEGEKQKKQIPKNPLPIIIIFALAVLITVVLVIIVHFCTKKNKAIRSFRYKEKDKKQNIINAKYVLNENQDETTLFHSSYNDLLESIKVNGIERNITNTMKLEIGTSNIELKFKNKLSSLENLFLNCHNLNEVNLYDLSTDSVESTADMFNGCNNLQKINFTDFDTRNIKNISNMFSGCEKLTSIDMNIFKHDKLIDIQGVFAGCSGLKTINIENFNTQNVINMSKLFSGCSSLEQIDLDKA